MKQFTILAHGSRGDVQPYVALGFGLKHTGYSVRVAAPVQQVNFCVPKTAFPM